MINIVLLIVAFSLLYTIIQKLLTIYSQSKCIEPYRIHAYVEGQVSRKSVEYDNIIAHLGQCENCQQLVDDFFNGKPIEDHLVE